MENGILIEYEKRDGRLYLDLKTKNGEHTPHHEVLTVITGALSMAIRVAGESGHRTEGEIFRHVMDHLTNEFVNPDSFKDLEIKR
jgi:hypothetical protein